jgi:hypothetical protein
VENGANPGGGERINASKTRVFYALIIRYILVVMIGFVSLVAQNFAYPYELENT